MKESFLLDTSSLLYIIKNRLYQQLDKNCHLLDLTFYEYGNAVLNILTKRSGGKSTQSEDAKVLLQAFENISKHMTVLDGRAGGSASLFEIFELARKESLTFYDASYLHCCLKYKFSLITEDRVLSSAARSRSVSVLDSEGWKS